MIRKDRGDGHLYELVYPRLSLLYARIEFIKKGRNRDVLAELEAKKAGREPGFH